MKTLWSILRTMVLFLIFILIILLMMFAMGFIYVKISELIANQTIRYIFAMIYFAAAVSVVMWFGKKGIRFLLGKDE